MKDKDPVFAGNYEWIPEGVYEAVVVKSDKKRYFKQEKLYLWFQIISENYQGIRLFMPFNIAPRLNRSHKYYKAWVVAKREKPKKNDRMSPKVFFNKGFLIKVKTVQYGAKQELLPADDVYSVVEEIIEICAGG